MTTRQTLSLAAALVFVMGCIPRQPTESETRQIAAECSIIESDVYSTAHVRPSLAPVREVFCEKYEKEYQEMVVPGYRFRITANPELQTQLLAEAISRCRPNPKCWPHLFHWARDARDLVHEGAISTLYRHSKECAARSDEIFNGVLDYLADDLPAPWLAHTLSVFSRRFSGKEVPESVLGSLEAKSVGKSEAAVFLQGALGKIRRNSNKLTDDIGDYPRIFFGVSVEKVE